MPSNTWVTFFNVPCVLSTDYSGSHTGECIHVVANGLETSSHTSHSFRSIIHSEESDEDEYPPVHRKYHTFKGGGLHYTQIGYIHH